MTSLFYVMHVGLVSISCPIRSCHPFVAGVVLA